MHYADQIRARPAARPEGLVPGTRGHGALSSTASPASWSPSMAEWWCWA